MIARKLGMSEGTVKTHLHAVYEKLGVLSRTQLMIALADRSPYSQSSPLSSAH
jgi:DNA-binding NarL/FixJ family response regulator